jgi:hypothetical protein
MKRLESHIETVHRLLLYTSPVDIDYGQTPRMKMSLCHSGILGVEPLRLRTVPHFRSPWQLDSVLP